ncbi:phage tail tip fiber protein [Aeromonas caviae]|uniref:phage tail tip fiber protein n=1 Tax=Aeromonas caviae TaxID=648 RepID=UPI003EC7AC29
MASLTVSAWIAIASTAVSVVSMAISLSAMGNKPSFDQSDQGALANRKGKDDPRLVAFGNCLLPGALVYKNVNDYDKKWIVHNYSLGHGPLKAINQVYIDEQPIFGGEQDRSEQWLKANNEGFGNVSVGIRRGNLSNQTWPKIIENGDGQWTADMRGDGIASLQFLIERPDTRGQRDQSDRVMATSFGASALVEGIKVIDPRVDQLLLGASDPSQRVWMNGNQEAYRNPVLQLLVYLLDTEYGLGLKPKMVNINTFINSANWCEQNSFYGDGYVSQNDTFQKIINNFATAFGGNIYLENGQICVCPDTIGPVVTTIGEDDLIGNITVTNNRTGSGYANLIKVEFQNKDSQFNKDTFIIPSNSLTDPTILADGKVFEKNLDCPMSTNVEYIKRFANRELKREKYCRKEAVFTINNLVKTLKINDVFVIENSLYELDANTKWRVVKVESELGDKVLESKITAQQYDARVYDTSSYLDGNTGGDLGRPNHVILPVTDLQFVQNQTTDIGSGMLTWTTQYQGNQRFRIQYRLSGSSSWTQYGEYPYESVMLVGLQTGKEYDYRVQCAATIGSSSWTTITNKRVNKSITLPAVKNLAGNFTSPDAVFTWDGINEPIVNNSVVANTYTNLSELVHYYEVQVSHGVVTKKTYRATTPRFVYSFDENSKNGANRDVTAKITAISIYGDRGATTEIRVRNEPMSAPSGVLVKTQLINLTVTWLNPSDLVSDYSATDIWITDSKTTAPTSLDLVASSSVGFWTALQDAKKSGWIWLAHRDVFGHESIPVYSAPVFFKQTTIDEELSGSGFEDTIESIQNNIDVIEGELDTVNTEIGVIEGTISRNKTEIDTKLAQQQATITAEKTRLDGQVAELNTAKNSIASQGQSILKNATDIQTNKTSITSQGARLTTVEQVASDNTGSIATTNQLLETINGDLGAKIETNKQSIVTTNSALSTLDQRLTAKTNTNAADILSNKTAIATTNSSMAAMDTRLTAKTNTNAADILTNKTAITTTNSSMASMNTSLQAQIDTNRAGVSTNTTAIAATDKNLADYKLSVSTSFGATNGRIDTVSSSLSTLENTVATQGTSITANYNDLNGKISTNSTAIVNANKAITSLDTKLTASIGGVDGKADAIRADVVSQGLAIVDLNSSMASMDQRLTASISGVDGKADAIRADVTSQGLAIVNLDQSLSSFKTSTAANFGAANSRIDTTNTNLATTNKALSDYKISADSRIGQNTANITSQGLAIVNLDQSLSSYKTSNNAEVAGIKSSVTTVQQAVATTDGKVSSIYGLRVDANGKVAGMTLNANNNSTSIDFLADTLRIASSTTGTPVTAFEVRGGQVMMRNALIGSLTASQISADAINGNHIAANSRITVGSGITSATMSGEDPNWRLWCGNSVSGQSPFKVSTEGRLYASNAIISGKIDALEGTFNNVTYQNGTITGRLNLYAGFIDGGSSGDMLSLGSGKFRVTADGSLYANNGTFGGTIYADKISGDIVNAGLYTFGTTVTQVASGQLFDVFRMSVPAVSWERHMLINRIPMSWRSLENGGRFNMYYRDSTGRNQNVFGENKPMGLIDGYPSMDNVSIRIPAGCTWVAISIQGDRRQTVGYGQLPIETNWQVFKSGSGGISITT